MACRGFNLRTWHDAQLHLAGTHQGVGLIGGIGGIPIEIAVLAQEIAHTLLLGIERKGAERHAALQQLLLTVGGKNGIGTRSKTAVLHTVEAEKGTGGHVIGYLCLFRMLGFHDAVVHIAPEEAVVPKGVACHLGACLRGNGGDEHRRFAEMLEHPPAEAALTVGITVIDSQPQLQRLREGGTAEHRAIGGIGQGSIHLFLGGIESLNGGFVLGFGRFAVIFRAFDAHIQLLAVRNLFRRRTGSRQQDKEEQLEYGVLAYH